MKYKNNLIKLFWNGCVVTRKMRIRPHKTQLHVRGMDLIDSPPNFIYSQRGKGKILIKPLKERQ